MNKFAIALLVALLTGCAGLSKSLEYPQLGMQRFILDGESYLVNIHPDGNRMLINWYDYDMPTASYNFSGRPLALSVAKQYLKETFSDLKCKVGDATQYSSSWEVTFNCYEVEYDNSSEI